MLVMLTTNIPLIHHRERGGDRPLRPMEEKKWGGSHRTSVSMGGKDRSEVYLSDNCVEVFQDPAMHLGTSTQHVELQFQKEILARLLIIWEHAFVEHIDGKEFSYEKGRWCFVLQLLRPSVYRSIPIDNPNHLHLILGKEKKCVLLKNNSSGEGVTTSIRSS